MSNARSIGWVAEIGRIEEDERGQLSSGPPSLAERTVLPDKLLVFDRQLSVDQYEKCAFCHRQKRLDRFTGPISKLKPEAPRHRSAAASSVTRVRLEDEHPLSLAQHARPTSS
jgi:hypothetical protein